MDRFIDWLSVEDHFWTIVVLGVLLLIALGMASIPEAGPGWEPPFVAKASFASSQRSLDGPSGLEQLTEFFRDHR